MQLEFDHIALSVPAIPDAVRYYRSRFPQTAVLYEDETWALIRIDSAKIAFVLEEHHPPHMAFRVESRDFLFELAKDAGKKVALHRDGSESFYQEDPGGNAIEIIFYP